MTEDEAKTKWCPFGRRFIMEELTAGVCASSVNEPNSEGYRQDCIGSGCMAWRWNNDASETGVGYCGLAGK